MKEQTRHHQENCVFIAGDSIIKHINGYEISGKLENWKVFVRPCHGATIRCLEDHVKLILRENPDEIIFHIGTNDLISGKGNKDITEAIINLGMSVKTQSCGVSISGITVRKDKHQNKVQEINDQLRDLCQAKNVNFIDHSKSIKSQHLNKSRLHLTRRGTSILSTNFVREISKFFIDNIFYTVQIQMSFPVVTNPLNINLKFLEKPAKLTI